MSLHISICEFQEKINESGKFEAFVAGKQGNAPQQRGEFNISKSECVNTFNPFCTILQKNKMTDMHTAALMADHFDKIQKLPNPIEGVPNFRCVPGYQVIKHFSFVTSHGSYKVNLCHAQNNNFCSICNSNCLILEMTFLFREAYPMPTRFYYV